MKFTEKLQKNWNSFKEIPIVEDILFYLGLIGIVILIPSVIFLMFGSNGHFKQGFIGYIHHSILSVLLSIVIIFFFFAFLFSAKKLILKILVLLFLPLVIYLSVILLAAPFRDIKYLKNPKSVEISVTDFDIDTNTESSTFYKVYGKDKNDKIYIFDLNKKTYYSFSDLYKQTYDMNLKIEYLPHTDTVWSIEYLFTH